MTVQDNPGANRYEIIVDGEPAGVIDYVRTGDVVDLVHTETYLEGRGVGSALVAGALDDIRSRGLLMRPSCPFVRAYVERHPAYQDLVASA